MTFEELFKRATEEEVQLSVDKLNAEETDLDYCWVRGSGDYSALIFRINKKYIEIEANGS